MNLATIVTGLRSAFIEAVPGVPVYLQLAPPTAQVPFAVMRVSSIDPGDGDLDEKDYTATATFAIVTSSDAECLSALDRISDTFDRGRVSGLYSTLMTSASFDIQYTEQAAMWVAESSFSVRWTTRA
jgi:hypothetical protein